jgi:hypothetical protein
VIYAANGEPIPNKKPLIGFLADPKPLTEDERASALADFEQAKKEGLL